MYQSIVKPIFDFFCAFFGFVLLLPIFLVVTFLLFIANSGKPFFFQLRPGKNGKIFKIIKFKTMNDKKDKEGNLLSDAERLTKVGSFVRKTSLDEIPQLLNVIKGDMSLIGPRPLLPSYLEIYSDFENRRHEVKPGITGWAQVNGWRGDTDKIKRIECDIYYIQNWSLLFDLKILFLTIFKGFTDPNAY